MTVRFDLYDLNEVVPGIENGEILLTLRLVDELLSAGWFENSRERV